MKYITLTNTLILTGLLITCVSVCAYEGTLKAGIYENPPLVFIDDQSEVQGIYPDIMDHIARKEKWNIIYIPGTWPDCLRRLREGKIDILLGIAWSEKRAEYLDFNSETILSDWGQLCVRRQSNLESLIDLKGKTIAVLKEDIFYEDFKDIEAHFNLQCSFLELGDYGDVIKAVEDGKADAGLVDRLYALQMHGDTNLVKTPIVCCPVELRMAFPKGMHPDLIATIDKRLEAMKRDDESIYHKSINRWIQGMETSGFPSWLKQVLLILAAGLLILALMSVALRQQVQTRTSELRKKYDQLEKEIMTRKKAQSALIERDDIYRRAIKVADAVAYQRDFITDSFQYVGEGIFELTGYRKDEFSTSIWRSMIKESVMRGEMAGLSLQQALRKLLKGETSEWRADYQIITRNGNYKWLADSSVIIPDSLGRPKAALGILQDITERKRMITARDALQRLSQKLTGCRTPEEIGRAVASEAMPLFQYDSLCLFHISPERKTVRAAYVEDKSLKDGCLQEMYVDDKEFPISSISKPLDEPVIINRVNGQKEKYPGLSPVGDESRLSRSLLFAPIFLEDKLVGRLSVQSYTPHFFQERDLRLLQTMADHCGAALARTRVEQELKKSEKHYRLMVETAEEGVWLTDARGLTTFVNKKMASLLGYEADEIIGMPMQSFVDREVLPQATQAMEQRKMKERAQSDIKFIRKDGRGLWSILTTNPILDEQGDFIGSLAMVTDITERKMAEEQLIHDAFHDLLTGLPNRALFLDRLGVCIQHLKRRSDYLFAVLFLDLDRFKNINDSLGHISGDHLLIEIGRRLSNSIRPGDTVARLGGDEFCVLLDDMTSPEEALNIADRIQKDLTTPVHLDGHEIVTTASIGIAYSASYYKKPEDMLRDADTAMYRAKDKGRMRQEVFNVSMHEDAVAVLKLEADMRQALERDEFKCFYQPIISLTTGRISGFEVLLRWLHPKKGLLKPDQFLSLAEDTDLIIPIFRKTLSKACKSLCEWQTLFPTNPPLSININISGKQFIGIDLCHQIEKVLSETGLNAENLNLEITESMLMKYAETTIKLLKRLKALNLKLHIDDFGTGYSSLSYLHRFPVDAFKIDSSFVSNMDSDHTNREIIRTILALARNLNFSVTAEGVETETQLEQLREMECPFAQGNFISYPVEDMKVIEILES